MESKSKRSKKKRTPDFENAAGDSTSGIESDAVVYREECSKVDGDAQMEKYQKKKKTKKEKKSKSREGFDVDSPLTQETVSANLSKEDKSERKKRKKVRHSETLMDRVYEKTLEEGSLDVNGEIMKEKERRNKRNPNISSEEIVTKMGGGEELTENKKTSRGEKVGKKSKRERKVKDREVGESMGCSEEGIVEMVEKKKKKRKRENQKENDNLGTGLQETVTEDYGKEGHVLAEKMGDAETDGQSTLSKTNDGSDEVGSKGNKKNKKTNADEKGTTDPKQKKKSKKVRFSSDVEVFPSTTVQGKRFTKEEDEIVENAVLNYIEVHGLGDKGLDMVMHCKSHPEVRHCWKEIGASLPYRPYTAVYYRAHNLFERSDTRKWTEEDIEFVKNAHERGNDWKSVAIELGRHRIHVKDVWRRIKLKNRKKGRWNQEEYQNLYDLVNVDLQLKLHAEEKLSKHGMLRDNVPWGAISEKLSTRSDANCCEKWYKQLTSSMVAEGIWANADDYRLIGALYEMDASCEGDVDWDNLLEHRSGDVCRKRWNQMVLHIGHHGSKPFIEQVEALAQRYRPNLEEAREAWDNMPYTDL